MKGGIWRLTQLGRKRAGSIYSSDSSESSDSITSYLYDNKTASIEELSAVSGKPSPDIRSLLRKLESNGLVEQVGGR